MERIYDAYFTSYVSVHILRTSRTAK